MFLNDNIIKLVINNRNKLWKSIKVQKLDNISHEKYKATLKLVEHSKGGQFREEFAFVNIYIKKERYQIHKPNSLLNNLLKE